MDSGQLITIGLSASGMAVFFVLAIVAWSRARQQDSSPSNIEEQAEPGTTANMPGDNSQAQSPKVNVTAPNQAEMVPQRELPAQLAGRGSVAIERPPRSPGPSVPPAESTNADVTKYVPAPTRHEQPPVVNAAMPKPAQRNPRAESPGVAPRQDPSSVERELLLVAGGDITQTEFMSRHELFGTPVDEESDAREADTPLVCVPEPRDEILEQAQRVLREANALKGPTHQVEPDGFAKQLRVASAALAQFEAAIRDGTVDFIALEGGPLRVWTDTISHLCSPHAGVDVDLTAYLEGDKGEILEQVAAISIALRRDRAAVRRSILESINSPLPAQLREAMQRAVALWDDPEGDELARAAFDEAKDDVLGAEWFLTMNARGARPDASALGRALSSSEATLVAAGLRALTAETGASRLPMIEQHLVAANPEQTMAALEAGVLVGSQSAWVRCCRRAREPEFHRACELMGACGGKRERKALRSLAMRSEVRGSALKALGLSGRRQDIEICVAQLDDTDGVIARAALSGLSRMTGYASDVATSVGGFVDAKAAKSWWTDNQARFEPRTRYIHGRPYDVSAVAAVFRSGAADHRRALAREVWIRSGGAVRLRHDLFVEAQRRDIATLQELELDFDAKR